jgi:Holliday junction resolvasome RuvABC endonuclease subunit
MAIVCGIDLSLNSTGMALIDTESNKLLDYKLIKEAAKSKLSQINRMCIVVNLVNQQINIWNKDYKINLVRIEDAVYKREGYSSSASVTILLSRISGGVIVYLYNIGLEFDLINTQTLKHKILGDHFKKDTAKEDMYVLLSRLYNLPSELNFKNGGNDITDAIGLAIIK